MATGKGSGFSRSHRILLGALASVASSIGCNSILGIPEGHLVGTGGKSSPSSDSGAGGEHDSGAAGASAGGRDAGTGGAGNGGVSAGGSGTGGSATGGSATGGSGAGGRGGAAGQGGTSGAAGAGGGGGGGGVGGAREPADVAGEVHCGTANCKLPGQLCCVDTTTGDAHCATSCDSTSQVPVSCDGAEDCTTAKPKCCYPTGGTEAACMATCQGRVFCGKDSDCAPGQRCSPGTGALATVFICVNVTSTKTIWCGGDVCAVGLGELCCYDKTTKTEHCAKACNANDIRLECDNAQDCASGASCCETHTGLGVFTGSECVAGGCAALQAELTCGGANGCMSGQQCCLAGTGSSCSATCSGDIVCGTSADCPSGQSCAPITTATIGSATGRTVCTTP